jgi:hypothetical protein
MHCTTHASRLLPGRITHLGGNVEIFNTFILLLNKPGLVLVTVVLNRICVPDYFKEWFAQNNFVVQLLAKHGDILVNLVLISWPVILVFSRMFIPVNVWISMNVKPSQVIFLFLPFCHSN